MATSSVVNFLFLKYLYIKYKMKEIIKQHLREALVGDLPHFYRMLFNREINDFPSSLINEGLIKSFDYEIMVQKLQNLFSNKQVDISFNHMGIRIFTNRSDWNKQTWEGLESLLNVGGYVISRYFKDDILLVGKPSVIDIFKNDYRTIELVLIKKFDIENQDGLPEYLYHVTENNFLNKIRKNGLVPKSLSKMEQHPDRVYFFDKIEGAKEYERILYDRGYKNLVILRINVKLVNEIKLYYDPTFFESIEDYEDNIFKAFYTYNNITPYSIEILK